MKIALICELASTERHGGEQHAMLRTAEGLRKINNDINIYSYNATNETFRIQSAIPFKLRLLPFIRDIFFLPFIARNLIRKIENDYEIIMFSTSTLLSLYKSKTRTVAICHILRSQKFEVLSKIPKYKLFFNPALFRLTAYLEKKSLENTDRIIVIREHQRSFLIERLKIKPEKIVVIPNGIDTMLFRPHKIKKVHQVIFVGRGTVPKGLDTLLKASDKIKGKILIVTKKIDKQLLEIAKSKSNVEIRYNASSDELAKLYNESEVFTLPSLDEEQPLTVMEAMACGLPVVVTDKAAADIVEDKINGIKISQSSETELADACNYLLSDKNTAKKISSNNIEKITTNFSFESVLQKIQKNLM